MAEPRIDLPLLPLASLCQRHGVVRLALFGSVLREDFGPDSDIDILVEFAPDSIATLLTLEEVRSDLAQLFDGRTIDLVTPGALHPMLRDQILSEARDAYAA